MSRATKKDHTCELCGIVFDYPSRLKQHEDTAYHRLLVNTLRPSTVADTMDASIDHLEIAQSLHQVFMINYYIIPINAHS